MLYIVSVDYIKFAFDDHTTAMNFAALAKNKAVEEVTVRIELKYEEEVDE